MDIINNATEQYRQSLQPQNPDPLARMTQAVELKINSPEAEQKLRAMGQMVAQEAAQGAQIQTASAVDKATTNYKQSFFQQPQMPQGGNQ